jgi:hypothetical protein
MAVSDGTKSPKIWDIAQDQLIEPDLDFEREPLQQGFDINIGEVFEIDFGGRGSFNRDKTIATVYGTLLGQFTLVAQDVLHGDLKNMGGRVIGVGREFMLSEMEAGRIKRIGPALPSFIDEERIWESSGPAAVGQQSGVAGSIASNNDEQMAADGAVASGEDLGGIDFNAIDLEREGAGIDVQFDPTQVTPILSSDVCGIVPIIIDIRPVSSVLPLLGLEPTRDDGWEISRSGK